MVNMPVHTPLCAQGRCICCRWCCCMGPQVSCMGHLPACRDAGSTQSTAWGLQAPARPACARPWPRSLLFSMHTGGHTAFPPSVPMAACEQHVKFLHACITGTGPAPWWKSLPTLCSASGSARVGSRWPSYSPKLVRPSPCCTRGAAWQSWTWSSAVSLQASCWKSQTCW
jgi:hypothetical protein